MIRMIFTILGNVNVVVDMLHPLHVNNYCINVSQTLKSRKLTLRGTQVSRSVTVFYAMLLNLCR